MVAIGCPTVKDTSDLILYRFRFGKAASSESKAKSFIPNQLRHLDTYNHTSLHFFHLPYNLIHITCRRAYNATQLKFKEVGAEAIDGYISLHHKRIDMKTIRMLPEQRNYTVLLIIECRKESTLYRFRATVLRRIPKHRLYDVVSRSDESCLMMADKMMTA
jgi:hypothetical protein